MLFLGIVLVALIPIIYGLVLVHKGGQGTAKAQAPKTIEAFGRMSRDGLFISFGTIVALLVGFMIFVLLNLK